MLFFLECILPYVAAAVFLLGMTWRTWIWLRVPVPFSLALTTEPRPLGARVATVAGELAWFGKLYRGDRKLWVCAWLMHASLALVIVGHVVGIGSLRQQFVLLGTSPKTSVLLSTGFGELGGLVLTVSLIGLLCRRLAIAELRRLSDATDYLALALLLLIALGGMAMRWAAVDVDVAEVRSYVAGLLTLHPAATIRQPLLLGHLTLVNVLLICFPFSKLVHLTGALVGRAMLVQSPPVYPTPPGAERDVPFLSETRGAS